MNKAGKNDLSEANIAGKKSNDSSHDDDGNREFSKVDVVNAEVDDNKGKEGCHASGKKSTLEENHLSATTHGDKSGSTITAKIALTKANIGEKNQLIFPMMMMEKRIVSSRSC